MCDYINGDINEDKKIDSEDYALIKSYLSGSIKLTDRQLKIADMNSDGKVSMEDLQLIESKVINSDKTNVTLKIADSNDVNNLFDEHRQDLDFVIVNNSDMNSLTKETQEIINKVLDRLN